MVFIDVQENVAEYVSVTVTLNSLCNEGKGDKFLAGLVSIELLIVNFDIPWKNHRESFFLG